jgi:tRNA(Ile)-lysidine synthase
MKVEVRPGKYIVAVSGGVDSMALLHRLSKDESLDLVIAHFNHGIRDGAADEELVKSAAAKLGIPLEVGYGRLGPKASEDRARQARYGFLNDVKQKHQADAIITAHHQDDLIETAIINLLRGSGHRGMYAISSNKDIVRPLLGFPKTEILAYAHKHQLAWNEDPTNTSRDYLRNLVRLDIMPKMNAAQKRNLIANLQSLEYSGRQIEAGLAELEAQVGLESGINRGRFSALPAALGNELLVYWLRRQDAKDIDRKTVNRLNVAIRTAKNHSKHPVKDDLSLIVDSKTAHFSRSQ